MLHSLTDKLFGCKGEDKCVWEECFDISSLILRADLCRLTAARNAIIDRYDTRKLYVKRTSLRTKLKDSLTVTVTLLFELRYQLKIKAAHWRRRNA